MSSIITEPRQLDHPTIYYDGLLHDIRMFLSVLFVSQADGRHRLLLWGKS